MSDTKPYRRAKQDDALKSSSVQQCPVASRCLSWGIEHVAAMVGQAANLFDFIAVNATMPHPAASRRRGEARRWMFYLMNERPGRPSKFTQELADAIYLRLMEGESLREICADAKMPARSSVFKWLLEHEVFANQYAYAREVQMETMVDEMKDIADDGRNDWMEKFGRDGKSIGWEVNGEAVMRSKLRVDQRRWHASKLNPKKYGDKQEIRHADPDGNGLAIINLSIAGRSNAA